MIHRAKLAVGVAMLVGVLVSSSSEAWACGTGETQRYQSQWVVWCIDDNVWSTGQSAFQNTFFAYGDAVVQELESLFGVTPNGLPLIIEAVAPDGGAQTPPKCCGMGCDQNPCLGEAVTGDAYTNADGTVQGFWGYLLTLHELINQWTGYVAGGWPTDFWADHISAFPNSMDWQIMAALGAQLNDTNLTNASALQKARFYPGGDGPPDPRVPMFDDIFALPNSGFPGWTRVFAYVRGDGVDWDGLGVANPAELRTEYVTAYVSLGPGQSVLPILQATNVANGTADGAGDPTYTAKEANVDAIATAHCSIASAKAAGVDETADLMALTSGNFAGVTAHGKCGSGCPSECGCKASSNLCVAPWLADETSDGGSGTGPMGGDAGLASPDAGVAVNADGGASDGGGLGDQGGAPAASSGCACGVLGHREGESEGPAALAIAGIVAAVVSRLRPRRR